MEPFVTTDINTTDDRTWTFNIDELNDSRATFHLDAPQKAKKAVAQATDARYRDLRARLVNPKGLGDTYVTVVEIR